MLPQVSQDRLRLLLDVTNVVNAKLTLKELLLAVTECLRKFFDLDWASIVIKNEESGQLRIHALNAPAPGGVLVEPLGGLKATTSMAVSQPKPSACSLEDVERRHIVEILEQTRGVIGGKGGNAEILGLPSSTFRNRMKQLGLK